MARLALFYLLPLLLTLFCLVEAISSRDDGVRNLPRVAWILLILFFPVLGPLAWLLAGRPQRAHTRRPAGERATPDHPEYDRRGRMAAADPAADAAFLKAVRERAEDQRRRAAEQERARRAAEQPEPEPEPE